MKHLLLSMLVGLLLICSCNVDTNKNHFKNSIIIAVSPGYCSPSLAKAIFITSLDSIVPVRYLFKTSDTNEISFFIKNNLHKREPYFQDSLLFKQLTNNYYGFTTISFFNKKGDLIYNHDIKTFNDSEMTKLIMFLKSNKN